MAHSGVIMASGMRMIVEIDPPSGSWANPVTYDEADLADVVITASGGAVTVVEVETNQYPWADVAANQVYIEFYLSRAIAFGETVTVALPAGLVTDGTLSSAAIASISITNYSYEVDEFNPYDLLDSAGRIVYLDPTNGNDTNAAAVNSSAGYYVKADVGADPSNPSIAVVPYKTLYAAFTKGRNSTSTSTIARHFALLIKAGETVDGSSGTVGGGDAQFFNPANGAGMIANTGGTAYATPMIIGRYGSGANPILQAQQTVAGGAVRALAAAGSAGQFIVWLGVDGVGGVDSTGAEADVLRFSSASGSPTRAGYYFKRSKFTGNNGGVVYLGFTNAGFRQYRTAWVDCVFDGNNTSTDNGGIFSTDANWNDFAYRQVEIERCLLKNASGGGFHHGLYLKTMHGLYVKNCYFDDIGGSPQKIDSIWAFESSDNVFTRTNGIGNNESNGHAEANVQADRTKDTQTTETPLTANSDGAYTRWSKWRRMVCTDALAFGERGSNVNRAFNMLGPSHDTIIEDILCVFNGDNAATATNVADGGGSSNGYVRDNWDCAVRRLTTVINGTSTRSAGSFNINPADNDTYDAGGGDQTGLHRMTYNNCITYIGSGRTGTNDLIAFGADVSDEDYATSEAAGRSTDLNINYNCLYDATGYTNHWRNGTSSDLFSTQAAFDSDFNTAGSGGSTGNRNEDPGFSDPTYEISDYFVTDLGYDDLDDAYAAIEAGILGGNLPANLSIAAIQAAVLPKYLPASLSESNYNNTTIGFLLWTGTPPTITSIDPATGAQGADDLEITVNGTDFVDGDEATFSGTGITVNSTTFVDDEELTVSIDIAADATASARTLTITNADGLTDTATFTVTSSGGSSGGSFKPTVSISGMSFRPGVGPGIGG